MFILGLICCREGSKGVKQKNIKLLKNKALLNYTLEQALNCKMLSDLIISTDSAEIKNIAERAGVRTLQRPAELATDTASKWLVFIHALEAYQQEKETKVDYIVDMDVTVPLKTSADIEGAIQFALDNIDTDVVITGYEPERNPYFNMMEVDAKGYARIIKETEPPIARRQDAPQVYSLTPAAYVIKTEALYNYKHWSKAKCKVYPIPRERAIDIDTEFDFEFVEFLMSRNG